MTLIFNFVIFIMDKYVDKLQCLYRKKSLIFRDFISNKIVITRKKPVLSEKRPLKSYSTFSRIFLFGQFDNFV